MKTLSSKNGFSEASRGSAVLVAVMALAVISFTALSALSRVDSLFQASSLLVNRSKSFLGTEGLQNISNQVVKDYFDQAETPSQEGLQTYLREKLPELLPAGYSLRGDITVSEWKDLGIQNVGGPFRHLQAPSFELTVNYELDLNNGLESSSVGRINITMLVSEISPLQFRLFSDLGLVYDSRGGADTNKPIRRVHSNGDLCMGGGWGGPVHYREITSAGRLMHFAHPTCGGSSDNMTVMGPSRRAFSRVHHSSGCTNCDGSGLIWRTFALRNYEFEAFDREHGVPVLKIQGANEAIVQSGIKGDPDNASHQFTSNVGKMRFLVDPPKGFDDPNVRKKKFSHQSDIRIITGVWYLKNPADAFDWPGVPIWSDHPGRHTDPWGNAVGQLDLRERWGWTGSGPRRFSYYEYDHDSRLLIDDDLGVVSYGRVRSRTENNVNYFPAVHNASCHGSWIYNPNQPWCPLPSVAPPFTMTPANYVAASVGGCEYFMANDVSVHCIYPGAGTVSVPKVVNKLLATRGGIRNRGLREASAGGTAERTERHHLYPININLRELAEALADTTPGELGSYFGGPTTFMRRKFNGILFATTMWPGESGGLSLTAGSEAGFDGATDILDDLDWPKQGYVNDGNQVPGLANGWSDQQALPYTLCSSSAAGQSFDRQTIGSLGTVTRFRVPDCANYSRSGISAFPNMIRFVDGTDLGPLIDPAISSATGLTLASNIPVDVNGNFNVGRPWVPTLVAGDVVHLTNGNCGGLEASWKTSAGGCRNDPGRVTWNLAVLSGWNVTRDANSTEFAPGFDDNWAEWRGNIIDFTGSVVLGFHPVYYRAKHSAQGTSPTHMVHDSRFDDPNQRPPGMPTIWITNVRKWQRF